MRYFQLCNHLYCFDETTLGYYEYINASWKHQIPPFENLDLEEISEEECRKIQMKKDRAFQEGCEYDLVLDQQALIREYNSIILQEPSITPIIVAAANSTDTALAGLENRGKYWESAFRKVAIRKENENIKDMKDVLRYTFILDADTYGSDVNKILSELNRNFQIDKVMNLWKVPLKENPYQGVIVQLSRKTINENGNPMTLYVEVQFHTKDSYIIKMNEINVWYENVKQMDGELTDEDIQAEVKEYGVEIARQIPIPNGVADIQTDWD